jgi:hypothetical protein
MGDREQGDGQRQQERLGPRRAGHESFVSQGWAHRRQEVGLAAGCSAISFRS